ncbi:GntR family transcriptional regulator [Aestuariicoccus sp. MJ-SS9]|uniref:GntR family transcriptional regulator n=1 Tax=Aestuariicoccus sp. MJ-SS9 TaxID=3079855 RepID=UPI00291080B5|nr:GntR family transcriptional regulator [Aestuariicoccus sp. MJ-SS9]MDU8912523.1 GntR family transcriptional regulator [Aestuariicoccus sp. MJ-SS9]
MQPLASVPSRSEQVYHVLRDSICECRLEPGTHLVQEDIAEKLGVSRQPVQQAMLLLKSDGLVVEQGKRGLYVAPIDRAGMRHHYQIRQVLDELAARLVAGRVTEEPGFGAHLRREGTAILEEGARARERGDAAAMVRHDVAFHTMIYQLSGNPLIAAKAESHWLFLRRVVIGIVTHVGRGHTAWVQHEGILDALVAGD